MKNGNIFFEACGYALWSVYNDVEDWVSFTEVLINYDFEFTQRLWSK